MAKIFNNNMKHISIAQLLECLRRVSNRTRYANLQRDK
jgi:hypothetical protein